MDKKYSVIINKTGEFFVENVSLSEAEQVLCRCCNESISAYIIDAEDAVDPKFQNEKKPVQ